MLYVQQTIIKTLNCATTQDSSIVELPHINNKIQEILMELPLKSRPICICGPMAAGKTTLITEIAKLHSRDSYPNVILVQMSEEIDSRVLLGSYHTAEVANEFVWKPGCLTKAILNGHWIIFEDLHLAPSDVITLLNSVVEKQCLTVVGYGEISVFHPDFRLFATVSTHNQIINHQFLNNQWKTISLEPYSQKNVAMLTSRLFPNLNSVLNKLLDIFFEEIVIASKRHFRIQTRAHTLRSVSRISINVQHLY